MSGGKENAITFGEIALALANDYDSIFVIDAEDDSYVEYLATGDNKELVKRASGDDFYKDVIRDCRVHVHPDDQESFIASFKKEYVTEVLKNGNSFSLNYRLIIDGKPLHYSLKTIKGNDREVLVAVQNVEVQKKRELLANRVKETYQQIAGALASRYEAIFYINLDADGFTTYSYSDKFAELGIKSHGKDFFTYAAGAVRDLVHPDDMEYVISEFRREDLLKHLDESGSVTLAFRQRFGEEYRYVTANVVRPKNDSDHIILGIMDIDAQIRREQSLMESSKVYDELAMSLASRYEVIYRVSLVTNEYVEYSASEKYAKLEVGTSGADFFADSQRNMKDDIYVEDYPMMAQAITKASVLRRLEGINKFFLNYRLNLEGRPQYVSLVIMRPFDDSDYIIVALENIDEAKKREMEFEAAIGSALDMANRDALTGVKNKHAYVSAEVQIDNEISQNADVEFAIAVCDINGLKQVNDDYGHSSGDAYIKEACAIICEIFDHSPVYRIGGDEFVVILKGSDYKNRFALAKQFSSKQLENRKDGNVTLAYGLSEYIPEQDLHVQDVFERADALMYANKKRLKEDLGFDDDPSIESYTFVRFYEMYEKLLSAMVAFDRADVELIKELLYKISLMFKLKKGVVHVFRNPQEELEGKGEELVCIDLQEECVEFLTLRVVTSVMTSATISVYVAPDAEPLTNEELQKLDLVMRTTLSFVSRNRLRDTVYELAYFDESGYPNLRSLNAYIARMIQGGTFKGKMAVRYNLRHFSLINQEFGRDTGDRIIKMHYDTLLQIMGEFGFIARLGGDNFVGICPGDKLDKVVAFLQEAVIRLDDDRSVKVPSSAGVLVDTDDLVVRNHGDILSKIIGAYRVAQSGGEDRIVYYNDKFMKLRQKSASVQQVFSDALANEEFVPFYQPKVDINTGRIIGGEALCRWFRDGKMIPPSEFIPALEQTIDICKLDLYMIEHVCRDQRAWLDGGEGRTLVPMSLNLSRKHIVNLETPAVIERILDKYRIPHESIEVELTETTTDVAFSDLRRIAQGFRDRGIKISVDDFGIGFSSLNLLKDIPWDAIKIDRSFLPENDDELNGIKGIMFRGVVNMAHNLNLQCIAEGVETEYQIGVMRDAGCDIAQGYFYDKPLPKEEFEARLVTKRYD